MIRPNRLFGLLAGLTLLASPLDGATTPAQVQTALGSGNGVYVDGGSDGNNSGSISSTWLSAAGDWNTGGGGLGEDSSDNGITVGGDVLDGNPSDSDQGEVTVTIDGLTPNSPFDIWVVHVAVQGWGGSNGFRWGLSSGLLTTFNHTPADPGTFIADAGGANPQLRGVLVGPATSDSSGRITMVLDNVDATIRAQIDGVLLDPAFTNPAAIENLVGRGTGTYLDAGNDGNARNGLTSTWTSASAWTTESNGLFGEDQSNSTTTVGGDVLDGHPSLPDQAEIQVTLGGLTPNRSYDVHIVHMTGTSAGGNGFFYGTTSGSTSLFTSTSHPGVLLATGSGDARLRGVHVGSILSDSAGNGSLFLNDVNPGDSADRSQIDGLLLELVIDDTDGDGILDAEEIIPGEDGYITDPTKDDTDNDGFKDGVEVAAGTDPSSGTSFPVSTTGLPNLTYPGQAAFDILKVFNSTTQTPRGHGFVTMHRNLLFVPFANDGGGGNGSGGFTFLNISNPSAPVPVFTTHNDTTTTDGTPAYATPSDSHYAGNIREAHGYTFWGDIWCMTMNHPSQGRSGLQFWDLSNPLRPLRLSEIALSDITGGDYSPTAWWVCWQGRYAYVASTTGGLHIVDAADPANPVEVKRIPTGSLGGFRINSCFAVGNLLVLAASDGNGITTFDISDPVEPVLLGTSIGQVGYSMMVNGNRILAAHEPARFYNITDPTNIIAEGLAPGAAQRGGYGIFKDGDFYYGSSSHIVRVNAATRTIVGATNLAAAGIAEPDWDFATPFVNLIYAGNDHDGSALIIGDPLPDTDGPLVNMVHPPAGATGVALTSRVGLTFTDQIFQQSISAEKIFVRPVGGAPLVGRLTNQTGIINFAPDAPLLPNTTYEVVVTGGGVTDFVGNPIPATFTSLFSTGSAITKPSVTGSSSGRAAIGETVTFTAVPADALAPEFSWDFGDGTTTPFSPATQVTHTYTEPGNYNVILTLRDGGNQAADSFAQLAHAPLTPAPAVHSSTIVHDAAHDRVWNVNPDNGTVTAIDATTHAKLLEIPAGQRPVGLALGAANELWVADQDASALLIFDRATGAALATVALDYGAAPFGLAFDPTGTTAYVTLQGGGRLLRLDRATRAITGSLDVGPSPRGLAITHDGTRALVTRFRSPDANAEVRDIDLTTFTLTRVIPLGLSPGPDTENAGRGLPNYLSTLAISPDGSAAWLPSKKDNIQRGVQRDGLDLTFESTVRSIVSKIDLATAAEVPARRLDFNDRDMASAVAFSHFGNYVFVATQGTQTVEIVDAYTGAHFGSILTNGLAPQGLAVSADGAKLFVHNFMSRSVTVFAIGGVCSGACGITGQLADVSTVATETLSPVILAGKRIFYNAEDPRMNRDKYLSCATCHLEGDSDGRVWDFTGRGEGFRNTTDLRGRSGTGHGRVHWSANFDEIHDFEHDIRGPFGGQGFMTDTDFNTGTRSQTLGDPKAGVSAELDALAAYVTSLAAVPASPHRQPDGKLTAEAIAGREIYQSLNCASCHNSESYTDSAGGTLHDVGTLKPTSGSRLGAALTGIDTSTLRGIWDTAPYFHDGSAPDLSAVLATGPHHNVSSALDTTETAQLIAFLQQLDASNPTTDLVPATINFAALPPKTPVDPPFNLAATASSGLPVAFASSNTDVATIAGDLLTIQGTGSCAITATQPGNALHPAATHVEQTFIVSTLVPLFATYLTDHFTTEELNNPLISGPLADLDHDGVPNLLEYALGSTDPTDRSSAFPVLTSPLVQQLRITFLRRSGGTETGGTYISGDLTYQPVASADLSNWNIVPVPVPNPPNLPTAPEGFEWTSYAIPDAPETENIGFIKLKVDAE